MRKYIYFFYILLFCISVYGQQDLTQIKRSNYEGRHFLLGFMQNETTIDPGSGLLLKVYLSSNADANIDVHIPGAPTQFFSIKSDSVLSLSIPPDVENYISEQVTQKTIEINSDVPISIYAFSSQAYTTDAYSVIPVAHWGTEYVCMSYPNDQYQVTTDMTQDEIDARSEPRQSEFLVMAAYDSTEIQFQPKSVTETGKQTFRTYTITLNKGDAYLVKSIRSPKGTGDLSGTIIRSTKPVGFLTGHVRTAIPNNLNIKWDSKNHLIEMLMPTEAWGRHFVTVPLGPNHNGDMIRIANIKPNTTVTYQNPSGGVQQIVLGAPGSVGTFMYVNEPTVWISDKPIQVCQYLCRSGDADDTQYYDPSIVTIPPTEQFVTKILFQCPGNLVRVPIPPQFSVHYVALIADTASIPSLTIDGILVNSKIFMLANIIPGTPYCYGYVELKAGKHELSSDAGTFSGVFYGEGLQDAYSMTLGSSLTNPFKKDTVPPEMTIYENCGKIRGFVHEVIDSNFSGLDYAIVDLKQTVNYQWIISPISDTATVMSFTAEPKDVTQDGTFVIDIRDKNGNGSRYRFSYHGLKISAPKSILFDRVNSNDSLCYTFYIKNYGKDSVPIGTPALTNYDSRLRFIFDKNFPFLLNAGDSIKCIICFDPQGDTAGFYTEMHCGFDCDRIYKIPITCTVRLVAYFADGYDFGKVRVGDTVCSKSYIYNNGNSDIRIDSLYIPKPSIPFSVDTFGLFPKILKPGESLAIPVCFSPDSLINYKLSCVAYNGLYYGDNTKKFKSFDLKGRGSAPNVESLVVDWGRRRIGTRSDTTVYLVNDGTDTCTISLINLLLPYEFEHYSDDLNLFRKFYVQDSLKINLGFQPEDTIAYFGLGNYLVNWKFHKPLKIELLGVGSLPVIKTYDIDFGIVPLNMTKDTLADVILSCGNEKLTIDSVYYSSGDNNSFSFNSVDFKNIQINTNTILKEFLTFQPKHLGNHETIYEVLNDAMPAYNRAKAYIRLTGYAVPSDTLDAEIQIVGEGDIISCQTKRVRALLKNTGNVSLELQKLELKSNGITANWAYPNNLPVSFSPGDTLSFPIDVFTLNSTAANLNVTATFKDSLIRITDFQIVPKSMPVIIDKLSDIKSSPGDSIWFTANGRFPAKSEVSIDFKIILTITQKNLLLTAKNSYLTILEGTTTRNYSLNVSQEFDKVIIQTEEKLSINSDNAEWSFKLPFWVLLSDELNPPLEMNVYPEECYLPAGKTGEVDIEGVCVFSMRNIKLIADRPKFEIMPNPVNENLTLNAFLPEDNNISVKIFDKVGKKCYNYENLFLKKGNHSLIFEICNLTDGTYVMNIQTSDEIKSLIFIISK